MKVSESEKKIERFGATWLSAQIELGQPKKIDYVVPTPLRENP
jgi:hypothetical protein